VDAEGGVLVASSRVGEGTLGFERFWGRERDRVYRALALSLGDASLASEAVDEAMTRALERWSRVGDYEQPAAWVYRVALNWATSRRRKLLRRPTRRDAELDRPTDDQLPDLDLLQQLASLRDVQRNVLVLRFYLQFTPTEIAGVLDLPVGTVKSHLHRGLGQLRVAAEEASS
jgi:RNA polymerase sigma factor (sigma-70 family)